MNCGAGAKGQRPGPMPAQGDALGGTQVGVQALKGRANGVPPLQGFLFLAGCFPGRCPGLASVRTLGAPLLPASRSAWHDRRPERNTAPSTENVRQDCQDLTPDPIFPYVRERERESAARGVKVVSFAKAGHDEPTALVREEPSAE